VGERLVAAGGRVLRVVARANDREAARRAAYGGLDRLRLSGGQWRSDVARDPDGAHGGGPTFAARGHLAEAP
jgi:phosphoribosylamine-glycine ligase